MAVNRSSMRNGIKLKSCKRQQALMFQISAGKSVILDQAAVKIKHSVRKRYNPAPDNVLPLPATRQNLS
jgi:hypothetical protein